MSTKINNALQVSTVWCQEDIHYNVELIPTFTTKRIVISNSSSVGQTSLTLSSSDIQLNEYYKAIVRVEGSSFLLHLDLSKACDFHYAFTYTTSAHGFLLKLVHM